MAAMLSFTALLDSIATAALVGWLLKTTLLTAIACAYVALAHRAQPALRHAVAVGSLLAVVLLPVASKLLPTVSIPVLPATRVEAPGITYVTDPAPVPFDASPSPAVTVGAMDAVTAEPAVAVATPSLVSRASSFVRDAFLSATHWIRFGLVLWVLVAAALFIRLALAFRHANELSARASRIDDDVIDVAIERACRVLRVGRRPSVAISHAISIPMVVGVVRPRIILPAAAMSWSHQRLGVVLLHEIAHIRRLDAVWMLFAQVMNAGLWFHPLVRVLSLHVRRDSELACDDLVLAAGVRGSDYAGHLVSIAQMSSGHGRRDPIENATLAFAARSTLEQRVASILSARSRAAGRRLIASVVAASIALFAMIAVTHPTTAESKDYKYKVKHGYEYRLVDSDDEDEGEEWYDRAHDHYQKGRYDKAGRAYENAARFGYNPAVAYYNAGCSYALVDKTDEALTALEAAFDEGFEDLDMYASDEDLNSVRDDPRFKKLMDKVMNSDEADQRRRAASREYDRLAGRKDADADDWGEVGIELLRAGEYDRAATAFDNEFKAGGNQDEDALYNKACARALGGKTDEALKLLEQSIVTGSVDADHMEEDADLAPLHKNKRFGELVRLAEDLDLDYPGFKTSEKWHFDGKNVRHIDDDAKHWKEAVPHFVDVTKKHPTVGRAWSNLGYAQLKAEQTKESTASFQKALDLGYRPPTMMYNLACSTALSGEIDVAFAWLDKSEKAGFEVWDYARWDEDLDPLRADARYKELRKRWKEEERKHAEAHGVHIEID